MGHDIDHILDLRFGGSDEVADTVPLDRSVNRSIDPQGRARRTAAPIGTRSNRVVIG